MSMFASKNRWVLFPEGESTGDYWWDQRYAGAMSYQREAFVQHNEPNPILVEFRERDWYYLNIWDEADRWIHGLVNYANEQSATPEQISHARKVLTRLAKLEAVRDAS